MGVKKFEGNGDWIALNNAIKEARDLGYEDGSMDYPNPIALVKGEYNLPQKWHNMTKRERNSVSGTITGNFRNGPVYLNIFV
jgi:hypothetical protein